nr:uncharacterized protein LOC111418951 [Onthophagus taurus]
MFANKIVFSLILMLQILVFVKSQNYEEENYCDTYFKRCFTVCSYLTRTCVRKVTSINHRTQVIIEDYCEGELATRNIYTREPNKRTAIHIVCRLNEETYGNYDDYNVHIKNIQNNEIQAK